MPKVSTVGMSKLAVMRIKFTRLKAKRMVSFTEGYLYLVDLRYFESSSISKDMSQDGVLSH